MGADATGELSIIRRTYDFIAWYVPHLGRLPRNHRFGLGDRLVGGLYEFLEGLIHARWSREKRTVLEGLNARLDVLRYQTRLLRDYDSSGAGPPRHEATRIGSGRASTGESRPVPVMPVRACEEREAPAAP